MNNSMPYASLVVLSIASGLSSAGNAQQIPTAPDEPAAQPAEAVAEPGAPTLQEIIIEGRFLSEDASSALKLDVPVKDIPFTVASYTDAFMRAIEATRVADLYNYMTGVQRAGNTGYDLTLRGFKSGAGDRNSIMIDGLPGLASRFGSPPTINADHIEVVKGPASVLYGSAQPGGFVNIATKKPLATSAGGIDLRLSGWQGDGVSVNDRNGYNVTGDFTGPIDDANRFLYRLIFEYGDGDSYRDHASDQIEYVSPSLTWNIGEATSLTWAVEYRHGEQSVDQFLVAPNRDYRLLADRTTHYQQPGDTQEETGKTSALTLGHVFANDTKWTTSIRNVVNEDKTVGYETQAIRGTTAVGRRARNQKNQRSYHFLDSNFSVPFATGSVEHKMLIGVNGGRETSDFERLQFYNAPAPGPQLLCGTTPAAQLAACGTTDPRFTTLTRNRGSLDIAMYAPDYVNNVAGFPYLALTDLPPGPGLNRRFTESTSLGAYVSDLVTLSEQWKAMAGLRFAREKQDFREKKLVGVPSASKEIDDILPMVGVLFQPRPEYSFYASYSTSFVPPLATALDVNNTNSFDPETAKQIEVGVKADLFDRRVTSAFSAYKIDKEDVLTTFGASDGCPPIVGTCTRQNGKERAQGVELEINAQPIDSWQVAFGYSYTDTEIVQSEQALQVGSRLQSAPLHAAHVWSRYDVPSGLLQGFGIGLGVVYTGFRLGILPTNANPAVFVMPGYTTADLGLYYVRERFSSTLRVSNLLNRYYIETGGFSGETQIQPGAPRNIALSMKVDLW